MNSLNLAALPGDLLLAKVTSFLTSRMDILNLALSRANTCSPAHPPVSYAHVHLGTAEQRQRTLSMLRSCLNVARLIQKLYNRFSSTSSDYMVDGIMISALLRELPPKLDAPHVLTWDMDEISQCDDM
ncbi:hypothetical protein BDR04DRAFT_1162130 [Suillus decipiens]|nr:hypothetical protein BDR04DRAFT_1162130 [Suillus decipiens]